MVTSIRLRRSYDCLHQPWIKSLAKEKLEGAVSITVAMEGHGACAPQFRSGVLYRQ